MSDNGEIKLDGHMPNCNGDFDDEEHAWLGWINRSDENKPGWMNCGFEMSGGAFGPAQLIRYVLSAHFKKTNSDFTAKDWNDLIGWISRDNPWISVDNPCISLNDPWIRNGSIPL